VKCLVWLGMSILLSVVLTVLVNAIARFFDR